jgi:hypothetical protein
MFKIMMSVLCFFCLSFSVMADTVVNPLYASLENKNGDKPYPQFIEPLAKIVRTAEPLPDSLDSLDYIEKVTGLKLIKYYETPIIEKEGKIRQYDFKTDGYSSKASENFVVSFFVVNHTVEKIVLNVQSRYEDKYYLTVGRGSCLLCLSSEPSEADDNMNYFKKKMNDSGWVLENSVGSFFTSKYVFTKGDIELVARNGTFYPLEIDIKRKDLVTARDKFDDLAKLDREMLSRSVEENRKKRFED